MDVFYNCSTKLDTSSKVVSRWVSTYCKEGIEALKGGKYGGNRRNMSIAEEEAFLAREKTSGIKIHIGVDINGLSHAIHITIANVTDRDGALEMFEIYAPHLTSVVKALVDGGYTGEKSANAVDALLSAEVEVAKRNELHTFAIIPKHWVVERTFGWLEKYRRLWKNCERKIANTLQMIIIAFLRLLVNRY